MKRFSILCLVAAFFLAGCGSSGVQIKPEQVSDNITEKDAIARFGKPTSVRMLPNGNKELFYTHTESTVHAYQVLPIVMILTGGPDTTITAVELEFDPDGNLVERRFIKGDEAKSIYNKEKETNSQNSQ